MYASDNVQVIVSTGIGLAACVVAVVALVYVVITVAGVMPLALAFASAIACGYVIARWNSAHPWM